jgi:hypothetical protein
MGAPGNRFHQSTKYFLEKLRKCRVSLARVEKQGEARFLLTLGKCWKTSLLQMLFLGSFSRRM